MSPKALSRVELLQGTLDLLILRTLLPGPMHGHAIAKHIKRTSEHLLHVETGSLYPCVHRLEANGWTVRRWSEQNLFFGGVQAVARSGDALTGGGDPRRGGYAALLD